MERIEIPAEVYYVAHDGKKFTSEEQCKRYEYLLDKYMNAQRHAICEDGDGRQHHFFYAWNKQELFEVCVWSLHLLGYKPRLADRRTKDWDAWERGWLWLPWEEQYSEGPTPELGTVDEFIELQEECAKSYLDSANTAKQIRNASGPRI